MTDTIQAEDAALTLVDIARLYTEADRRRKLAAKDMEDLEVAAIALTNFDKGEGSATYAEETDHGRCKVVLNQRVNTSVDMDEWGNVKKGIGGALARKLMKPKYSLVLAEMRLLEEQDPATYAKVAKCISRKPGKVSFEVKELVIRGDD